MTNLNDLYQLLKKIYFSISFTSGLDRNSVKLRNLEEKNYNMQFSLWKYFILIEFIYMGFFIFHMAWTENDENLTKEKCEDRDFSNETFCKVISLGV